jgi:hypothetical protein
MGKELLSVIVLVNAKLQNVLAGSIICSVNQDAMVLILIVKINNKFK